MTDTDTEVRGRAQDCVILLGEHTDYTGGLVISLAIERRNDRIDSRRGHALLLDCRTLEARRVPFPEAGLLVAVCTSQVKHVSVYDERVDECVQALEFLRGVSCLGELKPEHLPDIRLALPDPVRRRCEHIVQENERVRQGCAALEAGDIASFGRLMFASHESLRDLYEVSCAELDALFEAARAQKDAVLGAKMTGESAVVCLVREPKAAVFEERLRAVDPKVAVRFCRVS